MLFTLHSSQIWKSSSRYFKNFESIRFITKFIGGIVTFQSDIEIVKPADNIPTRLSSLRFSYVREMWFFFFFFFFLRCLKEYFLSFRGRNFVSLFLLNGFTRYWKAIIFFTFLFSPYLLRDQERERRRYHGVLVRAIEARKRYEERERRREEMKEEKRATRER